MGKAKRLRKERAKRKRMKDQAEIQLYYTAQALGLSVQDLKKAARFMADHKVNISIKVGELMNTLAIMDQMNNEAEKFAERIEASIEKAAAIARGEGDPLIDAIIKGARKTLALFRKGGNKE